MKSTLKKIISAAFIIFAVNFIWAESGAPPFSRFSIITQRNMFDPERRPYRKKKYKEEKPENEIKAPEKISLSGVIVYNKKAIAIFQGTSAEYNVELEKGDMIAGFKILGIHTDSIELENEDGRIKIPVGSGLSKTDDENWESVSSVNLPVSGDVAKKKPGNDVKEKKSENAGASDLLKRLMERRKREMN
jgi:hypothetical protein